MADPNIFAQYLRPVRSVAEYSADYDKQEANALELAAMRQKSADATQARADDQAMRQAYQQSGGDTKAYRNALVQAGNYRAVQALDAADLERQKNAAEVGLKTAQTGKAVQETAAGAQEQRYKAAQQYAQELAYVNTPQDVLAYIQQGMDRGIMSRMTPEQIQQKLATFTSVEDFKQKATASAIPALDHYRIEAENERNRLTNQTSRDNNRDTNATSRANNQATNATTMRGQNMTDARQRDANATALTKPFEVTGEDGKPMLVQQDKQGNIRPVQGYGPKTGADKALTEGQSKAVLFGSRMEAADKILAGLAEKGTTTSAPGSRAGYGIGAVVTALSNTERQQLDQAKRDFINATLRRESGAAIAESEFDNAEKQYFPQIGDKPEVIRQKAQNRAIAIRGMQAEIPPAQRGLVQKVIGGQGESAPQGGSGNVINFSDLK